MKPRKPIKRATPERQAQLRRYRMLRPLFLAENRICFKCGFYTPRDYRELHHWFGKVQELLCYEPGFRMACHWCHQEIETHRKEAVEKGWRAPENLFGRPSKVIPKVQIDHKTETMRIGKVTYPTVG